MFQRFLEGGTGQQWIDDQLPSGIVGRDDITRLVVSLENPVSLHRLPSAALLLVHDRGAFAQHATIGQVQHQSAVLINRQVADVRELQGNNAGVSPGGAGLVAVAS